jgi:photosystem II stability/assembly factor-like uncharacterized protein
MKKILFCIAAYLVLVILLINRDEVPQTPSALLDPELLWQQHLQGIKGQLIKTDRPHEFAKYHWLIRTRAGSTGPEYVANYKLDQLKQAQRNRQKFAAARRQQLEFVERGPGNLPGRTRALIVLPDDPTGNTWIAGAVGGGLWRTDNAGASWINLTPDLPSLAVSTITMSESNPNILYVGTGESFAGLTGIRGDGIFKSTDGGFSWTQLPTTIANDDFQNVNRIIVSPTNPDIVLVCTSNDPNFSSFSSGIFRSTNGGSSWDQVYDGNRRIQQLLPSPDNFNIIYATLNNGGVLKSTNQGASWVDSSTGMVPDGRVEIAIAPDNPNLIYASVEGAVSGTGSDLYISEDAGANWAIVVEENDGENLDFLGGQGNYDNTIAVHPYDDNIVYVGGVNLFKFTIQPGEGSGEPTVLGVDVGETTQFMDFVTFDSGVFFQSKLAIGEADPDDFVSIEWRFGPGRSQMAHRFTVPANGGTNNDGGAGVPDQDYSYQDYVEVPFEVWDIDNNRQLMVSFRDQQRDGVFNLNPDDDNNDPGFLMAREYFFAHATAYDPNNPDPTITVNGGHEVNQMYFMWPVLAPGATWNPDNLPDSKVTINYGSVVNRFRETTIISDAFNQLPGSNGVNRFFQSFGEDNTANLGLHPDHHQITIQKQDEANQTFRLVVTNDGGVYYSNISRNPGEADRSWVFAGNGYNSTQFYGADKKPGAMEFVGGSQDNGTYRSPSAEEASDVSAYVRQIGGDGFRAVWHYTDPDRIIGSSQYNGFRRTTDGGATWTTGTTGLEDIGEDNAPFVSWLANSKKSPNILYAVGRQGVWRSPDFGGSWELKPIGSGWAFNNLSRVTVSEADPTIIWAGSGMTSAARLHFSDDGGDTFTAVSNYSGAPLGNITNIATHPTQRRTAYAIFSFSDGPKILRTMDAGDTWEDISGFGNSAESSNGFPDVPVFSLLVWPHEINTIWAGTEIGLVESTDNGETWALRDDFINTAIWDMKAVDDQVVLGTHGRGIWTVTLEGMTWPTELVTSLLDDPESSALQISNYPNPVSVGTTIQYNVLTVANASLEIFTSTGQLMERRELGNLKPGPGELLWLRDPIVHSPGVYLLRLNTDTGSVVSRMILK